MHIPCVKLLFYFKDALYERKSHLKQKDLERRKNEKLNDLEEEQKQQADYMLAKAQEQRYEQEDEIKNLNQVRIIV